MSTYAKPFSRNVADTDPPAPLSKIVQALQPSATLAAGARAKELIRSGVQVQNLTQGEPNFDTPQHIRAAAIQAMDSGKTHYTEATGIVELKQAICDAYQRDYGGRFTPANVAVSNGAKHAIHNVLTCLCDPGDEVIIPAPYWVSYSAIVELVGATPVLLETTEDDCFVLDADRFAEAITPRTKLMMLNNPGNPTGTVYPVAALEAIGRVAVEHNVYVLSDEIYDKLIYGDAKFHSLAALGDEIAHRTILINGVSKSYAMTGWRIGWTIGPKALISAITRVQGQQTSNPCSISQHAAIAALNGPQDCVQEMRDAFAANREFVISRLRDLPQISFAEPEGAFYAFFNVSPYFDRPLPGGTRVDNSTDFCAALLDQAHVALVSGDAFGAPGYVRLSFATDLKTLEAGCDLLAEFLSEAE